MEFILYCIDKPGRAAMRSTLRRASLARRAAALETVKA
jgi:hypothetical protein